MPEKTQATIFLVNYDKRPDVPPLDEADRQVLEDPRNLEQNYVIRTQGNRVFLVGSNDQGLLYAATTLIQLINRREEEIRITTAHIRDFPSFKYRVASDWLLNNEINRWAYDYGDGREKYLARAKKKTRFLSSLQDKRGSFRGLWLGARPGPRVQLLDQGTGKVRETTGNSPFPRGLWRRVRAGYVPVFRWNQRRRGAFLSGEGLL